MYISDDNVRDWRDLESGLLSAFLHSRDKGFLTLLLTQLEGGDGCSW